MSFEKSNVALFSSHFTLPIFCVWTIGLWSHCVILVNDTWMAGASYSSSYLFYCFKFLKAFVTVFSMSQQTRLWVLIMHSLFLDKGPILLSAKAKGRAPVNCFKDICIMLSDWVSILSWIFSRHGCLSYQRKEKREKNKCGEKWTIKGRNWAFMWGHFDCVTDWFQVKQFWKRGNPGEERNS